MELHCFSLMRFVKVTVELFKSSDSYRGESLSDNDQPAERRWHWSDKKTQSCSQCSAQLLSENINILFIVIKLKMWLHIHPVLQAINIHILHSKHSSLYNIYFSFLICLSMLLTIFLIYLLPSFSLFLDNFLLLYFFLYLFLLSLLSW